jgi:hypothetical protein
MNSMKNLMILALISFVASSSLAADLTPIKFAPAGDLTGKMLLAKRAEIEAASGAPIEIQRYRSTLAVANLIKGITDVYSGPRIDYFFEAVQQEGKFENLKLDDYLMTLIRESEVQFATGAKNPVKSITKDQLGQILEGKITNWKSINGHDEKLEVYLPTDKIPDPDSSLNQFATGVKFPAYLTIRISARPEVHKFLEWARLNMKP